MEGVVESDQTEMNLGWYFLSAGCCGGSSASLAVALPVEAVLLRRAERGFRLRGWWRRSQLAIEDRIWGCCSLCCEEESESGIFSLRYASDGSMTPPFWVAYADAIRSAMMADWDRESGGMPASGCWGVGG